MSNTNDNWISVEGIEMPIELEIEGDMMRFILFPRKDGTWNCGYISGDLKTTFINEEFFIQYQTQKDAVKACKNALRTKGYLPEPPKQRGNDE